MTEALVCKYPDCDRTRTSVSAEFCVEHEAEARNDVESAISEAEHLTALSAQFIEWCAEHDQPHPYH